MKLLEKLILIMLGFSSGIVISGAVFAFIATVGIVERLANKTDTQKFIYLYEEAIIFGGIFGTSTNLINYYLPTSKICVGILSFCIGIFYGCLAMSLAEILNVIPILIRRAKIEIGLKYFIFAIALGKLFGSLIYYFVSGFYE